MANPIIIFVIGSIISIVVTAVFWLRYGRRYDSVMVPPNAPIVINNMPALTGGSEIGQELECVMTGNNRQRVTYLATDLELDYEEEKYPEPKIYTFIVDKGCRIIRNKGGGGVKTTMEYLAPNETSYFHLAGTPMEKDYLNISALIRSKNDIVSATEEANKNTLESLEETAGATISRAALRKIWGIMEDMAKKQQMIQQAQDTKGKK